MGTFQYFLLYTWPNPGKIADLSDAFAALDLTFFTVSLNAVLMAVSAEDKNCFFLRDGFGILSCAKMVFALKSSRISEKYHLLGSRNINGC
jgi:hypothetical protein